jgi:hypothetical protein
MALLATKKKKRKHEEKEEVPITTLDIDKAPSFFFSRILANSRC